MKALSLKQPFAELILQGKKTIELRKWNTKFRGVFLIHASKNPDWKTMKKFGFADLPCGFIVGRAELVEVKKYPDKEELVKDKQLHLANQDYGFYGFILKNVKRIKPLPASGQLGFWEYAGNP
ncbi:ASCH domain-containing protein [archaeon]|nr:ASCH domain-containing protein [archaeon]